ncbi:hypothetical protein V2J09_015957 [Rumex salicifolius]
MNVGLSLLQQDFDHEQTIIYRSNVNFSYSLLIAKTFPVNLWVSSNRCCNKSSEIPKTDSSQDSKDTSIRRDGGCNEASEIHFASVIKGGFQDSSSPNLGTSFALANVSVNGMVINPNVVRKAKKMAGPISPGEYWYDSRAGFWGAMGDHCLGIMPPFIQEFSSQMAENCSGGETCIYVNGRELHENDLDLLSGRGLPRTRLKYYVVDICGKVQDEDTGGFVVNLGKLAPTVESTGCGFGMHSTKALKITNAVRRSKREARLFNLAFSFKKQSLMNGQNPSCVIAMNDPRDFSSSHVGAPSLACLW